MIQKNELSITDHFSNWLTLFRNQFTDMNDEMKAEAVETCVTACEKFSNDNEAAAKTIKETMDKKFGAAWHTVVGERYGFEISYDCKSLLYMFFGGNVAICTWKCS